MVHEDEWEWDEKPSEEYPAEGLEIRVREIGGQRAAVMVPRSVQRLDDEGHALMAEVQDIVQSIARAREALGQRVHVLRDKGVSWDAIGWMVGTTGRAASKRWGGEVP